MSIKKIFKDGMAEHKRKSSLRSSKRNLAEKGKAYEVKLTALGKKARDAKLDISQFGDLSGTLSQVEEKGKDISAKLDELNKQTSRLEEKKKAENARFDAIWKDLETKKKPVDSELKSEKDKLEKAQKEADSIQKRLKNIPEDEEEIRRKIAESQGNAQAQAELEKKLTALKEEQKQLDLKLPDLTRFIQTAKGKITPLDQQSSRLEAEMKKAKEQHKKEIEDIDKTLSKVKGEINEFNKQQKAVSGQQVQNFQALGKKLSEANVADPAIAVELDAVKAGEKEMGSLREGIQSLESQTAPGARGAVWKMAGLILVFLIALAGIVLTIFLLSKPKPGENAIKGQSETKSAQSNKREAEKVQEQEREKAVQPFTEARLNKELTREERKQISENIAKVNSDMEQAAKEIPHETFDPQAIVDIVGKNPEAIFQWVKDNTCFMPYRGCLRGPAGVLMDHLGSSLDRSLLLADLLSLAGHEVRLAHTLLAEEKAKDLREALYPVLKNSLSTIQQANKVLPDIIEETKEAEETKDAGLRQTLDLWRETKERIDQRARNRAEELISMLVGMVGKDLGRKRATALDIDAMRDHWWVQVKVGDLWQDMDPMFPSAKPGSFIAEAKETYGPNTIPENFFHTVKVRIIAEQWIDNRLKENVVLEHSVRPSELHGQRMALGHYPMNSPEEENFLKEAEAEAGLKVGILKEKEWLPFLMIGTRIIVQSSFTDSGEIHKNPGKGSPVGGVGGTAQNIFSALGGGEGSEESKKKSCLTAEWLEYEITVPGEPSRLIRREIFDLIGPAKRALGNIPELHIDDRTRLGRGICLLGTIDILLQTGGMSQQFVNWRVSRRFLDELEALQKRLGKEKSIKRGALAIDMLAAMESLQGSLYTWALQRQRWSQSYDKIYLRSVNIVNFRTHMAEDSEGHLVWRDIFDIVNNDIAVHPGEEDRAARVGLNQGVADTVAESFVNSDTEAHENLVYLTGLSKDQGIKWILVRSVADDHLSELPYPEDVRLRIANDLAAGYFVLIPVRPVTMGKLPRLGWWRIHPDTGETLGVLDTGLHPATIDNILLRLTILAKRYGTGWGVKFLYKWSGKANAMFLTQSFNWLMANMGLQGCTDEELLGIIRGYYIELLKLLA